MGKVAIVSLTDMPIIMGITVFATLAIIVFDLAVDLAYAWIDPRIKSS